MSLFHGIFIGEECGWQVGNSLARGKGERAIAHACSPICFGKFLGNFFVDLESGFCFVVSPKHLGQLHEQAKAIGTLFFTQQVQFLLIELSGIFSLVEIAVDVAAALHDNFIFRKIFKEQVDGDAGL